MEGAIQFHAHFEGKCFNSDEDGQSTAKLTITAAYLDQYHLLARKTKRDLIVTVQEADGTGR